MQCSSPVMQLARALGLAGQGKYVRPGHHLTFPKAHTELYGVAYRHVHGVQTGYSGCRICMHAHMHACQAPEGFALQGQTQIVK